MDSQTITFEKTPSAISTLWKAFGSRKSKFVSRDLVPLIHVNRLGFKINPKHLAAFNEICQIDPLAPMNMVYPFTLTYPCALRILSMKSMPLSMFRTLNTRNSTVMYRIFGQEETLGVECYNSDLRIVPKGLEIDITSEITTGKEKIWKNIGTYFFPGRFGEAPASYNPPKLEPLGNAPIMCEWFLPATDRFRFARISGDMNGIHYGKRYARMQGFKRDFAQPIRVVAKCVSQLMNPEKVFPLRLNFYLKGPVFYASNVVLKGLKNGTRDRFELYCEGNDKPCISGELLQQ